MKILTICTVRFRLNGMTSVILNYYRSMDKTEMQIDFVVPNKISEQYLAEFKKNGSDVFRIPRKKNLIKYQKELLKIMRENHYDIVHVHGNSAMMLLDILPAVISKIPVRIVHSHNTSCSHMLLHKILLPIFNKCYTHGFACGKEAGKWLYGKKKFVELKNGIDLKKYQYNEEIRKEYREKINANGRVVIGHVGNFIEQKNHSFMLDWFSDLLKRDNKYLLVMISDGILLDSMKEKANQLGISNNVLFLGKTMEVQNYLQAMDIFVLPSLHEGFPVVLVEAQAAGLPCIVADTVTSEVDLTGGVEFVSIDSTVDWIHAVDFQAELLKEQNRKAIGCEWQKKIADAGYDISYNANIMKELYKEYCR